MGITEFIAAWGTRIIDTTGYLGVFFLMVIESMIPPVPSEAIMPFVGFLIAEGSMSAAAALALATLGSLVGSLGFYALGRYGGRPLVARYGRVFRLDERALDKAEAFFRRRGGITILVARFIPVVRPLISIPAGMAKMRLVPFCFYTIVGAAAWNAILVGCGIVLRRNWDAVLRYSKWLDIVALVLLVGLVVLLVVRHLRRRRRKAG
jgi:membrane protein DedA with SNARE-associated domain